MYFRSSCLIPSLHFLIFLLFFSLSVLAIIEGRVLISQTIVFELSISFLNSIGFALRILELCCNVYIYFKLLSDSWEAITVLLEDFVYYLLIFLIIEIKVLMSFYGGGASFCYDFYITSGLSFLSRWSVYFLDMVLNCFFFF